MITMMMIMIMMMMIIVIQIEVDDDDVDGRELAIGTSCQDNHKRSNDSCQLQQEATTVGNDSCQFAERGNRKFELRPSQLENSRVLDRRQLVSGKIQKYIPALPFEVPFEVPGNKLLDQNFQLWG